MKGTDEENILLNIGTAVAITAVILVGAFFIVHYVARVVQWFGQ